MRTHKILPWLILTITASSMGQTIEYTLNELSKKHQFIKMDSINNKVKGSEYYFYKALFTNVCNRPNQSMIYLDSIKNEKKRDSYEFIKLVNDNAIKLCNYELAFTSSKILTTKFKSHFTKEELSDEKNTQRIWQLLRKQPAQIIAPFSEFTVMATKDKAGLTTTKIKSNGLESDFVFDTGAGISCVKESLAKKMGIIILPDNNITIESFTGQKNKVLIGLAPEISIGKLKIQNTVFLVYPDSAFTFANGAYTIDGVIGFPIAKELGTITIEKDKLTFSSVMVTCKNINKNLFIDQLRAIVMLKYKGDILPFNFDSGASESIFYKSFYERFKEEIDHNGINKTIKSSGAGADEITQDIIILNDQVIYLDNHALKMRNMQIDKNNYGTYGKVSFGNIGQDLISQFKKVIISFNQNFIKLED